MIAAEVTYITDFENNSEVWWDALRDKLATITDSTQNNLFCALKELQQCGQVTLCGASEIEEFNNFVTSLPGWDDGPEYARTALIAQVDSND